jgi:predicted RNA-binding protein with TRAM domain
LRVPGFEGAESYVLEIEEYGDCGTGIAWVHGR